jgi:hypothetical protein
VARTVLIVDDSADFRVLEADGYRIGPAPTFGGRRQSATSREEQ